MSRPVKEMMIRDYQERLGDHRDALLVNIRGLDAQKNNALRAELRGKEIRVTVIRNQLFLKAFEGSGLTALEPLLTEANAVAYGGESVVEVARAIVDLAKKYDGMELKGAVLDGQLFAGAEGVDRLAKFPTREEAIAQDVTLILSPGRKLLGAIKGPGGKLLGIVKTIEEKLEKGEAISKVA
jgi:large subunit ribosomal protein L10